MDIEGAKGYGFAYKFFLEAENHAVNSCHMRYSAPGFDYSLVDILLRRGRHVPLCNNRF